MDNQKAKVTELPPQYFSRDDLIIEQLRDIGKRLDRVETRLDRIENRQFQLEEEIKNVRDELRDEIKDLRNDMKSFIRHSQILTASVVGLVFAFFFSLK